LEQMKYHMVWSYLNFVKMKDNCPNCGNEYEALAMHWSKSKDCDYPEFPQELKEITTGLLMGDGCLYRNCQNPVLAVKCVEEEYLHELSEIFGAFGNSVKMTNTGEKQKEYSTGSKFASDNPEYRDVYRWLSKSHPWYHELAEWYSTGEKVWPSEIEMTPRVLKHWYAGDGDLHEGNYIRISSINENDLEKISSYFIHSNLPEPNRTGDRFYWSVDDSKELFEYMGKPPSGYEYKWI